jgi:ferritin
MMLSKKMEKALNEQLNAELESSYIYLSLAAYFESENLEGFASWMQVQAQEEVSHAMKIYGYIHSRGGRVLLSAIDGPQTNWKSPKSGFQAALNHEKKITKRIDDLVELANGESDHASHQFLMWFVAEQVEEEESVSRVVDRLKMIDDAPGGIFMMDRELARRAFQQGHGG